jgi:putative ABC transport system permease protein
MVGVAARMLIDEPLKSVGTLIGVVVSVFLMMQQMSLLTGIERRVTSFADRNDVDVWVASAATEGIDATGSLPERCVSQAAGTRGVAWAAPVIKGFGDVTRVDGVKEQVQVFGVEAPRYAGLPRILAKGSSRTALRAPSRIFLNFQDRESFGFPEPGDRIEISGQVAIVAGFLEDMNPHSPYYYMFANIDDGRAYTGFPKDRVTFVAVGVAPGERPEVVRDRLQQRMPEVRVFTRNELHEMDLRYFQKRSPVGVVFGMGTALAALIGAGIVGVTLYSSVMDRLREFGTLKAIGASREDLLRLLGAQAVLFSAAGYPLGLLAFALVRHLSGPGVSMPAPAWLLSSVAAATLLVCGAASAVAIRRVLRVEPAIVFRG